MMCPKKIRQIKINQKQVRQFQELVYFHYQKFPRNIDMPWREDPSPYHVFLSECMLQQTQVVRVVEYFNVFISKWPEIIHLAEANLSEVLFHWQGLGYNRRAKFLHQSARQIVEKFDAIVPSQKQELLSLPGIGDYTSSAILAFAYNQPELVLETNIRRVILHHFFQDAESVHDSSVREIIYQLIDRDNPRIWYWALMDYGYILSKKIDNPNKKSSSYRLQSKFIGSERQVRAIILKIILASQGKIQEKNIFSETKKRYQSDARVSPTLSDEKISRNLDKLTEEGMVLKEKDWYYVP